MKLSVNRLLAIVALSVSLQVTAAQPVKKESKPYKILTAGRQITIKSSKNIKNVMVWTNDGHRVVEQKDINSSQVKLDIPITRSSFYVMNEMPGGKVYTERIGMQ